MTRKRKIVTLCLGALMAYGIIWYAIETRIEGRLMDLLAAQAGHGITITSKDHYKTGFPLSFSVGFTDLSATDNAGITVAFSRAWLGFTLAHTGAISFKAVDGGVTSTTDTSERMDMVLAPSMRGHFLLSGDTLREGELTAEHISIGGSFTRGRAVSADTMRLYVQRPLNAANEMEATSLRAMLEAKTIEIAQPPVPGLGNTIQNIDLNIDLKGALTAFTPEAVATWRDGGGTMEIDGLSGHWGPMSVDLDGTMALDGDLQPQLSGHASITGYNETLDALAASGAIKTRNVGLAKMGLSMIAKPDADGVPTLNVPVTIQNQTFYVANFKLVALGKIELFH